MATADLAANLKKKILLHWMICLCLKIWFAHTRHLKLKSRVPMRIYTIF